MYPVLLILVEKIIKNYVSFVSQVEAFLHIHMYFIKYIIVNTIANLSGFQDRRLIS